MSKILHTTIKPGEDMFAAICRAGAEAGQGGFDGYSVDCSKCGTALDENHTPEECAIYQREFRVASLREAK
jgi:hypothetical protein